MNIQDMKPGRELDPLVAEKVIGLNSHYKFPIGEGMMEGIWFGDPPDVECFKIPNYSTDISAAWEVVEKMKSQGFDICINTVTKRTLDIAGMNRENWHCCILKNETRSRVFVPTAPEAICKVALMALEGYHETD